MTSQDPWLPLFEKCPESLSKPYEIGIPGIDYVEAFLPPKECDDMVRTIDDQPWSTDLSRRVQHYGWRYDYASKTVTEATRLGSLPDWLLRLAERLYHEGFFEDVPDQVIINEYQPGQGIAPHIDRDTFGPTLVTLSLCARWPMEFTPSGSQTDQHDKRELFLGVGSLLVLKDDARYIWRHGIAKRKSDHDPQDKARWARQRRISVTFRTVRESLSRRGKEKIMSIPEPNWVQERARCTVETLFNELRQRLEADMMEMNKLTQNRDFVFAPSRQPSDTEMHIGKAPKGRDAPFADEASVFIHRTNDVIVIERFKPNHGGPGEQFEATPHWNLEQNRVSLLLGGDTFEVWQVSALILEPLFFGERKMLPYAP